MLYDFILFGPQPDGGGGGFLISMMPLILIFVVFWFFIIRPQRKKEEERKRMIESVRKGDRIVTVGGMHGRVMQIDETSVLAQVDDNTKVRIEKSAIASVTVKD